jgi:energy-coupling factor transport system permease protein
LPALAVPVLETGMEEAVTLAESMDARGHGRGRRTRYRPQRWSVGAVVTGASACAAAGAFIAAGVGGTGDLHPSTAPMTWPQASSFMIAALCLLAAPGLVPAGSGRTLEAPPEHADRGDALPEGPRR